MGNQGPNAQGTDPQHAGDRQRSEQEGPTQGSGAMFDRVARRYDLLNTVTSFGQDRLWRRRLVAAVLSGTAPRRVLDLATGTADVALALVRRHPELRVVGLDPSAEMLAVGRGKVAREGLNDRIELVEGDAQALPFADDSFDAACIAFGIRNVPDRARALREMARVVRPGGLVAVLELSEPRHGAMARLARWHVHRVVPTLGRLLSSSEEYRYLADSIAAFPRPETFAAIMENAGLVGVTIRRMAFGAVHLFVGRAPAAT